MEHMEEVYKGLTRDEIEEQYMLRNTRPSYEKTDIPRWKNYRLISALRPPVIVILYTDHALEINWTYFTLIIPQKASFCISMVGIGNEVIKAFIVLSQNLLSIADMRWR